MTKRKKSLKIYYTDRNGLEYLIYELNTEW